MIQHTLKCKDCGFNKIFSARTLRSLCDKARDEGWAISADNKQAWCPIHAELHRHVGKGGARPYVQIKLDV